MSSVPSVGSPTISQVASAHTLQAFIELVYIKTANDVMTSQMASLKDALEVTKSAMDTLTQIQNLKNLITVKNKVVTSAITNPTGADSYLSAASAIFGKPIQVSFSYSAISGGFNGFIVRRDSIIAQLKSQISALQVTTPTISGREDSNSLLAKLRLVLSDITFPTSITINGLIAVSGPSGTVTYVSGLITYSGDQLIPFRGDFIKDWVLDNYNSNNASSSGLIQQNITNAITAAQSLNTTQTESVRNFLYIFEEYYKSASAILQKIDQIINKMAGGIAR